MDIWTMYIGQFSRLIQYILLILLNKLTFLCVVVVGPTLLLCHEIYITRQIFCKAIVKDFLYKTWLFVPNIVLRNLGVAGRQLPLAMLSQWRNFINASCIFHVQLFCPKYTYLILSIIYFQLLQLSFQDHTFEVQSFFSKAIIAPSAQYPFHTIIIAL